MLRSPGPLLTQMPGFLGQLHSAPTAWALSSPLPGSILPGHQSPRQLLRVEPGVGKALGSSRAPGRLRGQHGQEEAGKGSRLLQWPLILLQQDITEPPWPQPLDVPQFPWGPMPELGSDASPSPQTQTPPTISPTKPQAQPMLGKPHSRPYPHLKASHLKAPPLRAQDHGPCNGLTSLQPLPLWL